MSQPSPVASRLFLAAGVVALGITALACSSSGKTTTGTTLSAPASSAASETSTTAAATSTTAAAAGALSGTWSGTYSGAYSGTFTLTWQQSGSNLSGTIMISSFNNAPRSINGTVQGSAISFGTVGSQAIQYSGTASGNSMSGTWQIAGPNGQAAGGGSWSASKSS